MGKIYFNVFKQSFRNNRSYNWATFLAFFVDNKILKITAVKKLFIKKLSNNLSQINTIIAFITTKNNPNVNNVTGNVNKTKIGLKKVLKKDNKNATRTEV